MDFQALKSRMSIMDVAGVLNLTLKEQENGQYRGKCPACNTESDRALVITPDRGLYYCFHAKSGGDQIALFAHEKGLSQKHAAEELSKNLTDLPERKPFDLDDYGKKLDPKHPAVGQFFPPNVAEALGAGFSTKGLMKDLVAVPIRLPSGKVIGYVGLKDAKVPKEWKL